MKPDELNTERRHQIHTTVQMQAALFSALICKGRPNRRLNGLKGSDAILFQLYKHKEQGVYFIVDAQKVEYP